MLADVPSDSHFDEEVYLQILHRCPDSQLDRALSRRCVATAVFAGRVALSPWLLFHLMRGVSLPLHACTAASRVLLVPSSGGCLLLLSDFCLSQCHSLS